MDIPTERFQLTDLSKPVPSKVRMLFACWLFGFYSPLLLIAHTRALTWCTRDNPVRAAPAQKYILGTLVSCITQYIMIAAYG